jgi:hypothetical protein
MPADDVFNARWTRLHDPPESPYIRMAPLTQHRRSLEDLIEICRTHPRDQHLRAAGSHWALSEAAVCDHTFVETHDPRPGHAAMDRTLYEVVSMTMEWNGGSGWNPTHVRKTSSFTFPNGLTIQFNADDGADAGRAAAGSDAV